MVNPTCAYLDCAIGGKMRRGLCGKHYQSEKKNDRLHLYPSKLVTPNSSLEERLRHHGWTVSTSGCWEWKAGRNPSGYGQLAVGAPGSAPMIASRAAYAAWIGEIPEGMVVCHSCDNPPCINPAHLFLGTRTDNNRDMGSKGRARHDERHPHVKLSNEQVRQIRQMYETGDFTQSELGRRFGVGQPAVSMIVGHRRRRRVS